MSTSHWTQDALISAVDDIQRNNMSYRRAAAKYGIPRSTLALYAKGKLEIGTKPGPSSVLTSAEESKLVEYVLHMSRIGYGKTKEELFDIVQMILEKDGRENPFTNNRPGRKWWKLFKQRHPELSLRSPELLQIARAKCSTSEVIQGWFIEFEQFLIMHGVKNSPSQIWNADEAGFPLCPKSGKVIAMKNTKDVYSITGDSKDQITCLCAASAAGDMLPPMHIFAGERFRFNPMAGCVTDAYFGRSRNGWITTELFYGWLANHFAKKVIVRPVVLLVDGHSSHIDLEVSKFCRENQILLFCLPPHSSHILQPLDVGFFRSLKAAWSKACSGFRASHPGESVSRESFAKVFREAWIASVKMSVLVNAFRESGLCPLNSQAVDACKLAPSMPYSTKSESAQNGTLQSLESMMKPETVNLYQKRMEEGYDVESDELYVIWAKLKNLALDNCSTTSTEEKNVPEISKVVSPTFDDVLVYPELPEQKKKFKSTSSMPKHLSSDQVIDYLETKKLQKQKEEQEKEKET